MDGANATDWAAAENTEKNIAALKAGFYSVVLYSQLPEGCVAAYYAAAHLLL